MASVKEPRATSPSGQVPSINMNTMSNGGMKKLAAAPINPQFTNAKYVVRSHVIAPNNHATAKKICDTFTPKMSTWGRLTELLLWLSPAKAQGVANFELVSQFKGE